MSRVYKQRDMDFMFSKADKPALKGYLYIVKTGDILDFGQTGHLMG
jgi:hypothetical protein